MTSFRWPPLRGGVNGHQERSVPRIAVGGVGSTLRPCPRGLVRVGISIDRRAALESQWKRQEEREALLDVLPNPGQVMEVSDLEHLESLCSSSQLVLVFMYSKACGFCKVANAEYERMCQEAHRQRARVIFLKHNIVDDWDFQSDISRFHKVKAVPTFLWLEDGAVMKRLQLRDIRGLAGIGSSKAIQGVLSEDMKRLRAAYSEMLFKSAPGARD